MAETERSSCSHYKNGERAVGTTSMFEMGRGGTTEQAGEVGGIGKLIWKR
jgi:hypothetical protein